MSLLSVSSLLKSSSKNNRSIEDFYYSEYAETFDPETNEQNSCKNDNGIRKGSAKRRRSRSLKYRLTSMQNKNLSSKVFNRNTGTKLPTKPIDPVDCPTCFATIKVSSLVKHIWDHLWDNLAVPSKEDPSFNLCHHCCRNFKNKEALQFHFLGVSFSLFIESFIMFIPLYHFR